MTFYLFLAVIFVAVTAAVTALINLLSPNRGLLERLVPKAPAANSGLGAAIAPGNAINGEKNAATKPRYEAAWAPKVATWLRPAAKLVQPRGDWMQSRIRLHLMHAGFRGEDAPAIYFGSKALLAVVLPLLVYLLAGAAVQKYMLPLVATSVLIGYYTPNFVLRSMRRERQREIFEVFPEALDLMVVCVEAGLGLDAAIARVGIEIGKSSPALGDEFRIASRELRAGLSRDAALRNLALRTGVADIDALVAMLIQTDKFGTSVADALRVHADSMRTRRMLRAEEAAQKLPIKLVFPLVLLIFPSMFIVLLGPTILAFMKLVAPVMSGGG